MIFEELPKPIPLGNAENIIGKRFDELVVLYRTTYNNKRKGWACRCDCGEYCVRRADSLKKDCEHNCNGKYHYADKIVGKTFGRLVIAKRLDEYIPHNGYKYMCYCSCGNPEPTYTWQTNLLNQHDQSCGCIHFGKKDLTNQKFGMLTAIKCLNISSSNDHSLLWECQCECGEKCEVSVTELTSGERTACRKHSSSYGEINIYTILRENNIDFKHQELLDECRFPTSHLKARFDFYFNNSLLEYDGQQHFKWTGKGWCTEKNYIDTHNRDLYKNQWAWENNIPMRRIPYNYKGKLTIERILSDEFLITPKTHPWWYPENNSSYPYFTLEDIDKLKEVS